MTVHERTQVGIVGAGPAGLLLSHLLALGGVDSVCVENRSRAYCEARQRAGMLEPTTVELLRAVGLGDRLDAEGLEHDGIYVQFGGERHHLNFRELTGGRWITIYAQTEIVKDLIAARLAAGAVLEFEVSDTFEPTPVPLSGTDFLDSVGGAALSAAMGMLAPNGTCVTFGVSESATASIESRAFFGTGGARLYGLTLFHELMSVERAGIGLALLAAEIASGRLKPQIAVEADWSEIGAIAQRLIDRDFTGKAVLHIG